MKRTRKTSSAFLPEVCRRSDDFAKNLLLHRRAGRSLKPQMMTMTTSTLRKIVRLLRTTAPQADAADGEAEEAAVEVVALMVRVMLRVRRLRRTWTGSAWRSGARGRPR